MDLDLSVVELDQSLKGISFKFCEMLLLFLTHFLLQQLALQEIPLHLLLTPELRGFTKNLMLVDYGLEPHDVLPHIAAGLLRAVRERNPCIKALADV